MKKLLLIVVALAFSLAIHAQETITLVVNGEGTTKEEATANALRSAIEQAFGVFVSANTQILNDEIVKDEIATIASGNIKEYKELGTVTMPDGRKSISLSATVSIKNLISYAKSKGSSAEFAGAVWGMNIKMRKLNAENERMAIDHLLEQLDILSRDMFKIELSTPNPPVKINWDDNKYYHLKKSYSSQPYFLDFNLTYYPTTTCKIFFDLLSNSIQSIALSDDEVKAYKESGEPLYELRIGYDGRQYYTVGLNPYTNAPKYYFRTDIAATITSAIDISIRNALLSQWQIVRSSTDKGEEPITFETLAPKHRYWKSYPQNRVIEWPTAPLITGYFNRYIDIDFFQNMMNVLMNPQITTFTIKIGYTEEELSKTTGFEITKREDFDVDNIQGRNEIWCTFSRFSQELWDRCAAPGGAYTYSIKNKCWIQHCEHDVTIINEYNGGHFHCADLTSISLPNSVTEIGRQAFSGCTGLSSITIPNLVTKIDYRAFSGCTGLTSISLPNSVTWIDDRAFEGCTGLTSIKIPDSVTRIDYRTFYGCTGLTSVTIPNSVTWIDKEAFSGCTGLTSISLPNSVTSIGRQAFSGCTGLTSVTIGNSVTWIEDRAFEGCTGLTSVTIGNSVTLIGQEAFSGCTGLTSITIPNSVTRINTLAFQNTHPDCVAYVPMGRAEYYKKLLSTAGFSGRVVEMSPNTHASNQIIEEEKTKVYSNPSSNQIIEEEEKTKVYSNSYDGYTNIRETPSLKGKVIGELRNGPDGAVLISKTEGWSKINCNGVEGYVYTKNLSTSPTEEVTISTDINWINGIWRNDNEQYAYLIFNNGTFAIQSTSGTLAYGTYILKGNDIEFSIKQFLSSMEISKIQRLGIDTSTNRIGQLRKMDFLSESEQYNNTYDLTWTKSQFNALKKEIRALL